MGQKNVVKKSGQNKWVKQKGSKKMVKKMGQTNQGQKKMGQKKSGSKIISFVICRAAFSAAGDPSPLIKNYVFRPLGHWDPIKLYFRGDSPGHWDPIKLYFRGGPELAPARALARTWFWAWVLTISLCFSRENNGFYEPSGRGGAFIKSIVFP